LIANRQHTEKHGFFRTAFSGDSENLTSPFFSFLPKFNELK